MQREILSCYLLFSLLAPSLLPGRPPGGDPDYRTYWSYAYVYVYDEYGNGEAGRNVSFTAEAIFGPRNDIGYASGTTSGNGYAYLSVAHTVLSWWGSPTGRILSVYQPTPGECDYITPIAVVANGPYYVNAVFTVDFLEDCDGNGIDDDMEVILANQFSPVFHKHSWDLQTDLGNFDLLLDQFAGSHTVLLITPPDNILPVYPSGTIIHIVKTSPYPYDSYGNGSPAKWLFDIPNQVRHEGAPENQRPVYYHIYAEDGYIYLQYWIFLNMNDLRSYNQTPGANTWHEGDWEHVTIQLSGDVPQKVNFYGHYGGYTRDADDCWWAPTNALNYGGEFQQGYDGEHTHLHVWVAANSHAVYNRNDPVYRLKYTRPDNGAFAYYYDNVDYNPSGNDLYFGYDRLENLGDITTLPGVRDHDVVWVWHNYVNVFGKPWLGFVGHVGDYWKNTEGGTQSPKMPPMREGMDWHGFQINYDMFGNELTWFDDMFLEITFRPDPAAGD